MTRLSDIVNTSEWNRTFSTYLYNNDFDLQLSAHMWLYSIAFDLHVFGEHVAV